MVRLLSPVLRRELANLDKDADSRKSAMKALEAYVSDMDSKTIPLFLAQVSETKETGFVSGEYTISLLEVLARVHGVNIVPQIDSIMSTIVQTLNSSAGSFPLQQACSRVVPAIARYGIEPTTPENKKRHVIHALCKPLSESLLGSQESLTSGAALCLKALVDSDNWRFASDEMVNRVCQNVTVALEEKPTQSNSHMGLKRLSAIQMVNFLMKSLDPRSIYSELDLIIDEMEKCQSDHMAFVSGAAFEAWQTARRIAEEEGLKSERESSSVTGSNFGRRQHGQRRGCWGSGEQSSASASPESQTLNSFSGCDSLFESPISSRRVSPDLDSNCRSMNRKLWRLENGGEDVFLKDGLFSQLAHRSGVSCKYSECVSNQESDHRGGNYRDEFENSVQGSLSDGAAGQSPISTPQSSPYNHGSPRDANNVKAHGNAGVEQFQGRSESVSSTVHSIGSHDVVSKGARARQMYDIRKTPKRTFLAVVLALFFILLAFGPSLVWDDVNFEIGHLVPT
ncbi:uncharacterized protein J3R85_016557 [Psidium guajava]|nr:uncharacterized protein J3R85_016557 [Psidium guajava]